MAIEALVFIATIFTLENNLHLTDNFEDFIMIRIIS